MPKRIQRRRTKGWRMPTGAVCVSRPSPWGNPFDVKACGSPEKAVEIYRLCIVGRMTDKKIARVGGIEDFLKLLVNGNVRMFCRARDHVRLHLADLRDKDLVCWCPLDAPCHGDVLLELANAPEQS